MHSKFVTVLVEEHEDVPDGCCLRFKLVDEPEPINLVRYRRDDSGPAALWSIESREADGSAGVAWAATVEDSGSGTSVLLYGGSRGLRLRSADGTSSVVEPYLLLSADAVVRPAPSAAR